MDNNKMEVLQVVPPRQGGYKVSDIAALLKATGDDGITLDLSASRDVGVTYIIRCAPESGVRQRIRAHLPGAIIRDLAPEEDPAFITGHEQAWSRTIEFSGEPCRSISIVGDDAGTTGNLWAVLFALDNVGEYERIMTRLHIAPCVMSWSKRHNHERSASGSPQIQKTGIGATLDLRVLLILIAGCALAAWNFWQQLDLLNRMLLATAAAVVLPVAFFVRHRFFGDKCILELDHADFDHFFSKREKPTYRAWIEVVAVLPPDGRAERAEQLINRVVSAYRAFDVYGKRILRPDLRRELETTQGFIPIIPPRHWWEFTPRTQILGVDEVSALWHFPGSDDGVSVVERARSVDLPPTSTSRNRGAHVGTTTVAGESRQVIFHDEQLRRHQFYIARSGMGKSTLMEHNIVRWLELRALDPSMGALVVVDPHGDLVEGVLTHIPEALVDQVYYLDLGNRERLPRINILAAELFSDGEMVADYLVRIFKIQWTEHWGGHMDRYLRLAFRALHDANKRRRAEDQYTLFHAYDFLNDGHFRKQVMQDVGSKRVREGVVKFEAENARERDMRLSSVNGRLSAYHLSDRAYGVLGHSESTIDIPSVIRNGGILLVNTASGTAGQQVGDLIGGAIIRLVDATVRSFPITQRRPTLLVIDEMQTLPAVDYEAMLSELRKYGVAMTLATQSMTALDEMSRTASATVLSNRHTLVVFQVSNRDAKRLVGELGESQLIAEDLSGQDPFHAYFVTGIGDRSNPPSSMTVAPPQAGDPGMAERIRKDAEGYTGPIED